MPFLIHKSRLFFWVGTNNLTRTSLSRISIVFLDNSEHWFSSLSIPNIYKNLEKVIKYNKLPVKQMCAFGGTLLARIGER